MTENEYYEWVRDTIETRIGLPVRILLLFPKYGVKNLIQFWKKIA